MNKPAKVPNILPEMEFIKFYSSLNLLRNGQPNITTLLLNTARAAPQKTTAQNLVSDTSLSQRSTQKQESSLIRLPMVKLFPSTRKSPASSTANSQAFLPKSISGIQNKKTEETLKSPSGKISSLENSKSNFEKKDDFTEQQNDLMERIKSIQQQKDKLKSFLNNTTPTSQINNNKQIQEPSRETRQNLFSNDNEQALGNQEESATFPGQNINRMFNGQGRGEQINQGRQDARTRVDRDTRSQKSVEEMGRVETDSVEFVPPRITENFETHKIQNDLMTKYFKSEETHHSKAMFANKGNPQNPSSIYRRLNLELSNKLVNPIDVDLANPSLTPRFDGNNSLKLFKIKNKKPESFDEKKNNLDFYQNPTEMFRKNHSPESNTLLLATPHQISRSLPRETIEKVPIDKAVTSLNFKKKLKEIGSGEDASKRGIFPRQNLPNRKLKNAFLKEKDKIKKEMDYIKQTMSYISKKNFSDFDFENQGKRKEKGNKGIVEEGENEASYSKLRGMVGESLREQKR